MSVGSVGLPGGAGGWSYPSVPSTPARRDRTSSLDRHARRRRGCRARSPADVAKRCPGGRAGRRSRHERVHLRTDQRCRGAGIWRARSTDDRHRHRSAACRSARSSTAADGPPWPRYGGRLAHSGHRRPPRRSPGGSGRPTRRGGMIAKPAPEVPTVSAGGPRATRARSGGRGVHGSGSPITTHRCRGPQRRTEGVPTPSGGHDTQPASRVRAPARARRRGRARPRPGTDARPQHDAATRGRPRQARCGSATGRNLGMPRRAGTSSRSTRHRAPHDQRHRASARSPTCVGHGAGQTTERTAPADAAATGALAAPPPLVRLPFVVSSPVETSACRGSCSWSPGRSRRPRLPPTRPSSLDVPRSVAGSTANTGRHPAGPFDRPTHRLPVAVPRWCSAPRRAPVDGRGLGGQTVSFGARAGVLLVIAVARPVRELASRSGVGRPG